MMADDEPVQCVMCGLSYPAEQMAFAEPTGKGLCLACAEDEDEPPGDDDDSRDP